jgi:hypothetical protein
LWSSAIGPRLLTPGLSIERLAPQRQKPNSQFNSMHCPLPFLHPSRIQLIRTPRQALLGSNANAHRTGTIEAAVVQLPSPQSWHTRELGNFTSQPSSLEAPRVAGFSRMSIILSSSSSIASVRRCNPRTLLSIELLPSIRNLFQEATPWPGYHAHVSLSPRCGHKTLDLPSISRCHRTKRYGGTSWRSPPVQRSSVISLTYNP